MQDNKRLRENNRETIVCGENTTRSCGLVVMGGTFEQKVVSSNALDTPRILSATKFYCYLKGLKIN